MPLVLHILPDTTVQSAVRGFFRRAAPLAYTGPGAVERHNGNRQLVGPDKVLREGAVGVPIIAPGRVEARVAP